MADQTTVRLNEEQAEFIEQERDLGEYKMPKSEVIRRALDHYRECRAD